MKARLTITNRFVIFLAAVIAALAISTVFIMSMVFKEGLVDLFRQRFEQAREITEQYYTLRYFAKLTELQALTSSPRFIAALETGDSLTVAYEAPSYQNILGAEYLALADTSARLIFAGGNIPRELLKAVQADLSRRPEQMQLRYLALDSVIVELAVSPVSSNTAHHMGWLAAASPASRLMAEELQRLTGFDLFIQEQNQIIGHSVSRLADILLRQPELLTERNRGISKLYETEVEGEEVVLYRVPSEYLPAEIIFAGSIDEHISPVRKKVILALMVLSIVGGVMAVAAIYLFASRRIGRQIEYLVAAAEKIAGDKFDFTLTPQSQDELGYLTAEFEKMRAQIVRSRKELEEAHRNRLQAERLATIGNFATGIIHDFKNPMTIIKGTAELTAERYADDEKLKRACTTINAQVNRMADLTRDILEYSRGRSNLEIKTVNLAGYFQEIIAFHEDAFRRAGLHIAAAGPDNIAVSIDPTRFQRVIDNIINNAREALTPGDELRLRWSLTDRGVSIFISDNGPGIAPEILPTIFDPFVTKGKEGGTGLGLAIARKIVEDHGATIQVESETGKGTVFKIELPLKMTALSSQVLNYS